MWNYLLHIMLLYWWLQKTRRIRELGDLRTSREINLVVGLIVRLIDECLMCWFTISKVDCALKIRQGEWGCPGGGKCLGELSFPIIYYGNGQFPQTFPPTFFLLTLFPWTVPPRFQVGHFPPGQFPLPPYNIIYTKKADKKNRIRWECTIRKSMGCLVILHSIYISQL